jgi:hypothetical protein
MILGSRRLLLALNSFTVIALGVRPNSVSLEPLIPMPTDLLVPKFTRDLPTFSIPMLPEIINVLFSKTSSTV